MSEKGTKRITGLPDAEARFVCYSESAEGIAEGIAEKHGRTWRLRKKACREACSMSQAEVHWLEQEAKQVHADMMAKTVEKSKALDDKLQKLNERCGTWRIGEEMRLRRLWIEAAGDWARGRIAGRLRGDEVAGFDVAAFKVEGVEGVSCDGFEARKRLKHAARWLPVYYEYVRQSPCWLSWVRMIRTCEAGKIMWDAEISRRMVELKSTLGGGWLAVFHWLAEWLGEDLPFTEVPRERRIQAAIFAANATLTDVKIDPEMFTVLDAGRPSFTAEAKFAGRQHVRLASLEESTITRVMGVYKAAKKEALPIHCRHVLNATIAESFHKPHKGEWKIGKTKIQRYGNDDLQARAVKDGGGEVLVLHVNWNETSNADLGRAFASLCEGIRPEKWPELVEVAGDQDQSADKALSVLLWWRMTAAINADVSFVGLGGDPKAVLKQRRAFKVELEKKRRGMAANVKRAKAEAERWFADITGDKEKPWWVVESVTNRK